MSGLERTRGLLLHANADMELILDALADLDRAEAVIQAARALTADDVAERAEMRWMASESASIDLPARRVAELGRALRASDEGDA